MQLRLWVQKCGQALSVIHFQTLGAIFSHRQNKSCRHAVISSDTPSADHKIQQKGRKTSQATAQYLVLPAGGLSADETGGRASRHHQTTTFSAASGRGTGGEGRAVDRGPRPLSPSPRDQYRRQLNSRDDKCAACRAEDQRLLSGRKGRLGSTVRRSPSDANRPYVLTLRRHLPGVDGRDVDAL